LKLAWHKVEKRMKQKKKCASFEKKNEEKSPKGQVTDSTRKPWGKGDETNQHQLVTPKCARPMRVGGKGQEQFGDGGKSQLRKGPSKTLVSHRPR